MQYQKSEIKQKFAKTEILTIFQKLLSSAFIKKFAQTDVQRKFDAIFAIDRFFEMFSNSLQIFKKSSNYSKLQNLPKNACFNHCTSLLFLLNYFYHSFESFRIEILFFS